LGNPPGGEDCPVAAAIAHYQIRLLLWSRATPDLCALAPERVTMLRFLLAVLLVSAAPALAQPLADTPENRARLARQLGEIEAPNIQQGVADMIATVERGVPPAKRATFLSRLGPLFNYETVRRYSDEVAAREMSTEELGALIAFYSTPLGHSVMLKMPQLARDTLPGINALMRDALGHMATEPSPPDDTSL